MTNRYLAMSSTVDTSRSRQWTRPMFQDNQYIGAIVGAVGMIVALLTKLYRDVVNGRKENKKLINDMRHLDHFWRNKVNHANTQLHFERYVRRGVIGKIDSLLRDHRAEKRYLVSVTEHMIELENLLEEAGVDIPKRIGPGQPKDTSHLLVQLLEDMEEVDSRSKLIDWNDAPDLPPINTGMDPRNSTPPPSPPPPMYTVDEKPNERSKAK